MQKLGIIIFVTLSILAFALSTDRNTWALLVAGSYEYYNYRHQSCICHGYQNIKARGIPDEHIIVMMYDDIAYNPENPTPGVIINQPDGPNVYSGVPKDYTGNNITAENFLNILEGNEDKMKGIGSGRVIKSNENDYIFLYYSDHGATGLVDVVEDTLYVSDFMEVLDRMIVEKKFYKMIIFFEACESGSMFDNLLDEDGNIFAMTSANPTENSFSWYYDDLRKAYIGDEFSVRTWEYLDTVESNNVMLHHEFAVVRTGVTLSHIPEYGNLALGRLTIQEFLGKLEHAPESTVSQNSPAKINNKMSSSVTYADVTLDALRRKLELAQTEEEKKAIQEQIDQILQERLIVDNVIENIISEICGNDVDLIAKFLKATAKITRDNMLCFKTITTTFSQNCFNVSQNSYAKSILSRVVKACSINWVTPDQTINAIVSVCSNIQ